MKFDTPAIRNPIDRLKVVGQPTARVDGRLKTTGTATYAYEQDAATPNAAYGYIVGAAIAKGRIASIDLAQAKAAPGVLGIVTADNAGKLGAGAFYVARPLAGPDVDHYHQAVAIVVAETFEQACAAAQLVRVSYVRAKGSFDLEEAMRHAPVQQPAQLPPMMGSAAGNFDAAFASAPVTVEASYSTPDHSHAMMEPHATIAAWDGDRLTLWTAIQLVSWGMRDISRTLGIARDKVRIIAPYIGGGFGGKGSIQADAVLAALAARQVGRPVKVALQRHLMFNNTTHRAAPNPAAYASARAKDGRISRRSPTKAWSGNQGQPARKLHRARRACCMRREPENDSAARCPFDLPGRQAPCVRQAKTPGMMALESGQWTKMAEKAGIVRSLFRILNRTPRWAGSARARPFSKRSWWSA
ncbi:molybdopterin cofactor-binding domain-containing protein [Massilia cavernae]|uniref:molybdopterin cofactor-binding domain-containing protein n=1 Tax=Massilia cavernae TaxID=2320864 RepID=UPI002368170F|nr:molybdopterin cofactor-binding domain-containing protein [Massilia cavernae]